MSKSKPVSLISEPVREITSYDIPLQTISNDNDFYYDNLPYVETTTLTQGSVHQTADGDRYGVNPVYAPDPEEYDDRTSGLSHGFFLGKESLQDLSSSQGDGTGLGVGSKLVEEEEDTEDEGIGEIYKTQDSWIRRSDRSFKNSPEPARHALAKRIANIGGIGQNIGLGHRLGVLTEDTKLIPEKVKIHSNHVVIAEDSPVQTDISWTKPANAASFASLIYKVEACVVNADNDNNYNNIDDDRRFEKWTHLADVRWPIFRLYHTDDKLLIGKLRVARRRGDVLMKIRVKTTGEIVLPDRTRHWTMSAFSKIVEVTFAGYDYCPHLPELQQTHL